jgi:hypothetical protein
VRLPQPLVLDMKAQDMWLFFAGFEGETLHRWPLDDLELGDEVAEALGHEVRLGAAHHYALIVKSWEIDQWMDTDEGRAALDDARRRCLAAQFDGSGLEGA